MGLKQMVFKLSVNWLTPHPHLNLLTEYLPIETAAITEIPKIIKNKSSLNKGTKKPRIRYNISKK